MRETKIISNGTILSERSDQTSKRKEWYLQVGVGVRVGGVHNCKRTPLP